MENRCPCCDEYSFPEKAGSGDICPVCFWEYDKVQQADPDFEGGANRVSLNEARKNYMKYGACEERFAGYSEDSNDTDVSDGE